MYFKVKHPIMNETEETVDIVHYSYNTGIRHLESGNTDHVNMKYLPEKKESQQLEIT
jgi:hypothetical protein